MKFASLLLATAAPCALAQNLTALANLLGALQGAGLTRLATVAGQLNSTDAGKNIFTQLSSGSSFVVFAPTNQAFDRVPSNLTSDQTRLADTIAYHVVQGDFKNVQTTYPNVTLGRTLLNDSSFVQLEGGKSQAIAWATRADGKVHVLNQRNDSIVVNSTTVGNITVNIVDHVLNIPESFQATIPTLNSSLTSLQAVLRTVQVPVFESNSNESTNSSLFDVLNTRLHGFTLFAPNNAAVQAAMSTVQNLGGNQTAIQALFGNHLINGSTLYSTELGSTDHTSAAGETLSLSQNATGQFVKSGNSTARIVQPDVLLPNGVIHIIDAVLINTDSNPDAASSAASSASSSASESSTATTPIGAPQTSGASPTTSNGSGGNSAASTLFVPSSLQLIAVSLSIASVVLGGVYTLV